MGLGVWVLLVVAAAGGGAAVGAQVLMLRCYELSELLERLQSFGCYGTFSWTHTFGVAQNQKQPCFPNSQQGQPS